MRIGGEGYTPGAPQSREPGQSKETRQFGDKKPAPFPSDRESAPLPEEGVGRRVRTEGTKGGGLPGAPAYTGDQAQRIQELIAEGADPNEILEELGDFEKSLQALGKDFVEITLLKEDLQKAMAKNDGGIALAKALEFTNERLADYHNN